MVCLLSKRRPHDAADARQSADDAGVPAPVVTSSGPFCAGREPIHFQNRLPSSIALWTKCIATIPPSFSGDDEMTITGIAHLQPIVALIAGILILIMPRLLNFIVAIYLIFVGIVGLGIIR
jgi:hypothetical protein